MLKNALLFTFPIHSLKSQYRIEHKVTWLVFIFLLFPHTGTAQRLLDYGTFNGYALGKGFLGNDYTTPLPACITWTEATLSASRAGVRYSIVYTADEYRQAFHIDQQAEASFLKLGGGSDELHFGMETGHSDSAFDIVIEAYGEHDSKTVNNPKWDSPYAEAIASGDPTKIQHVRETCGDRFIETVFYETRLFAVLHVARDKQSSLLQFSGKVSGKVDVDIVSAKSALGGDYNVSSAHTAGAITVDVYSEGLGGVLPTAAVIGIATSDGLDAISTKLAAYLSNLHENGQPVKYLLSNLPNLSTGNLSDQTIFDTLSSLKINFQATYSRLNNVKALLDPSDPRRLVLRQPDADKALRQQKDALTAYSNIVVKAHDDCRKAPDLATCTTKAAAVGDGPQHVSVELPQLITQPSVSPFILAIDGAPIPPGTTASILGKVWTKKTLLEEVRAIKPGATNVDFILPIDSPYLAFFDITAYAPTSASLSAPEAPFVGHRVLAQNLAWPTYWKGNVPAPFALNIVHADAQNPCNLVYQDNWPSVAPDCLTGKGHAIVDAVLAAGPEGVVAIRPQIGDGIHTPATYLYKGTAVAATTDCFGQNNIVPIASFEIVITAGAKSNEWSALFPLFLQMTLSAHPLVFPAIPNLIGPSEKFLFLVVAAKESHDVNGWVQLSQTRFNGLATAPYNLTAAGSDPCVAHIP